MKIQTEAYNTVMRWQTHRQGITTRGRWLRHSSLSACSWVSLRRQWRLRIRNGGWQAVAPAWLQAVRSVVVVPEWIRRQHLHPAGTIWPRSV